MISKATLWGLLASVTAELERVSPKSPVAGLARAYLGGEDLPAALEEWPRSKKPRERTRLNPARAIRVADLYAEGMSTYQIAAALGCSVATVVADLKRQGIDRTGQHLAQTDPQRIERLRQMRQEGLTIQQMGDAEGITRERVRHLCLKAAIDTKSATRPLNDAQKKAVAEYVAGASLDQAAATAKTHATTLRGWIVRAGEKVRPSPKTGRRSAKTIANAERAAQLYRCGMTAKEIARAVGLSKPEMIYRLLAIAGVRPSRRHTMPDLGAALGSGREL